MPASGVRSSCEASATKLRIRSSDSARAAKADSIWSSIPFSAAESRPTSVLVGSSGIRWESSPAAISSVPRSIRRSGSSPARTAKAPSAAISSSTAVPITRNAARSFSTVVSTSSEETATITYEEELALGAGPVRWTGRISTRQVPGRARRARVRKPLPRCRSSDESPAVGSRGPGSDSAIGWRTVRSTLPSAARKRISNWLGSPFWYCTPRGGPVPDRRRRTRAARDTAAGLARAVRELHAGAPTAGRAG